MNKKLIILFFLALAVILVSGCKRSGKNREYNPVTSEAVKSEIIHGSQIEVAVKAPPLTEGIYPCNDCHSEMDPNPVRRPLEWMHDDIDAIFTHDRENRWCLDCHDMNNRDSLRLANGKLLAFEESYILCGQCHGNKLRDWKVGVHGKRTGYWNGPKEYLLCVHCHNPHSPKFKPLQPELPPIRQEDIK